MHVSRGHFAPVRPTTTGNRTFGHRAIMTGVGFLFGARPNLIHTHTRGCSRRNHPLRGELSDAINGGENGSERRGRLVKCTIFTDVNVRKFAERSVSISEEKKHKKLSFFFKIYFKRKFIYNPYFIMQYNKQMK